MYSQHIQSQLLDRDETGERHGFTIAEKKTYLFQVFMKIYVSEQGKPISMAVIFFPGSRVYFV